MSATGLCNIDGDPSSSHLSPGSVAPLFAVAKPRTDDQVASLLPSDVPIPETANLCQ